MDIRCFIRSIIIASVLTIGSSSFAYYEPYPLSEYYPVHGWYKRNSTQAERGYRSKSDCNWEYRLVLTTDKRLYFEHTGTGYMFPVYSFTDDLGNSFTEGQSSIVTFINSLPISETNKQVYTLEVNYNNQSSYRLNMKVYKNGSEWAFFSVGANQTYTYYHQFENNTWGSYTIELKGDYYDNEGILEENHLYDTKYITSDKCSYYIIFNESMSSSYDELNSPFDNDTIDSENEGFTNLTVPDDWYNQTENPVIPEKENESSYNNTDNRSNYNTVKNDKTTLDQDENIPTITSLDDVNSDLTEQDIYNAMSKALEDQGNKYNFSKNDFIDLENESSNDGFVSELDNFSDVLTNGVNNYKKTVAESYQKLKEVKPIKMPENIGKETKIEIQIDEFDNDVIIDFKEAESFIELFRMLILYIMTIFYWIITYEIIRSGVA